MIYIYKSDADQSVFALNQTSGQVEETKDSSVAPAAAFTLEATDGELSYDQDTAVREIEFIVNDRGYLAVESGARAIADKLQYNGTFLEVPFVTLTIKSSAPVDWQIGDYVVWDYDNNKYYLRDIPSATKQASVGTYGEAFVYENVKFVSPLAIMKSVDFLDVVAPESGLHYTSLPTISFYGKVSDLLSRINANMSRLYAGWSIVEADLGGTGDVYEAMQEYKEVEVSNVKCWDALLLVFSMWKVGFTYALVEGVHTITVGAQYASTASFSYGKGNGLYLIAKNVTKEDSIITRLRIFGSTQNLPANYYNNQAASGDILMNEMQYVPNLMIPFTKWGTTEGVPDIHKAYIDCNSPDVDASDTAFAKYGIREASVYFDGTGDLKEIYPSIEQITADQLRTAIASYTGSQVYYPPSAATYPDGTRMDIIKAGDNTSDDGFVESSTWYSEESSFAGISGSETMTTKTKSLAFDPIYYATLDLEGAYNASFTEQYITFTNADELISFVDVSIWLLRNGQRVALIGTFTADVISATEHRLLMPEFALSTTEPNDLMSIELSALVTLSDLGSGTTTDISWEVDSGTATYTYSKTIPNTIFTIDLREIGFDIMKFLAGGGQNPSISMKSGACAGREFVITNTTRITDGWRLTCTRQRDSSTAKQFFPNNNFKIAGGDTFVLLNISMPDILIEAASLRLYAEGCKYLLAEKSEKFVYEPKIDEVYMAYNPSLIKEGMMMPVVDTDLGIDESVLINSVTINENDSSVRTYNVVLREKGDTLLTDYINERTKSQAKSTVRFIVNASTPKTQSASYTSVMSSPSESQESVDYDYIMSLIQGQLDEKHPLGGTSVLDLTARELSMVRLRLPKTTPTNMAANEWYLCMSETGFGGETPSGGGTVTSIGLSMPTGFSVSNSPIVNSGTLAVSFASGYSLPTTAKQLLWDTAYSWGNHAGLYAPISGGYNYIQSQSSAAQSANFWITGNGTANGTFSASILSAQAYNSPSAFRFLANSDAFAFGMYSNNTTIFLLQANYYAGSSYVDYNRGFRVYNNRDSATEFYTGHGRMEVTRNTIVDSELSDFQNTIAYDRAFLHYYHLDVNKAYARVLDIGAYGRDDAGYDSNSGLVSAESIIRFLYNTSVTSSGSKEAARFWRGCLSIGYTDSTAYSYKLSVNGTTYFNGDSSVIGTLTMNENVNTRLTIPSSAPTGMTAGRWYMYIS